MSRSTKHADRSPLLAAYALLVFAFLYLPIVVLIVYSFNRDGVGGFPPKHFTLQWYRSFSAMPPSGIPCSTACWSRRGYSRVSLILGLLAALALDRATFPGKSIFRRLVLLPLILPGIITGLSLLMFAVFAGVAAQPAHRFSRHGHRAHFRRHHRTLRRPAKNRSRAGRSLARPRRHAAGKPSGASPCQT